MIPFNKHSLAAVTDEEMLNIYDKIKTPLKHGAVMKWENDFTDCPSVFKMDGKFYMYFISISKDCSKSGYETHLASSDDLLNWEYMGTVLRRNDSDHWDSKQCSGYVTFQDILYEGTGELQKINGSYYMSYMAGNSNGYEPDPLNMGLAKTDNPLLPDSFVRLENPILMPSDADARPMETKTLYKSYMFEDVLKVTGYPYVNVYNAKAQNTTERIFLAVSNDGEKWERYGDNHILDMTELFPDTLIAGDPQIICIDDIYVMLFFHYRRGGGAYNTFACSRDLINWKVWDGEPLIKPTEQWENIHAHKPWFIRHNGISYHFYCAVNNKNERFIAVATSK